MLSIIYNLINKNLLVNITNNRSYFLYHFDSLMNKKTARKWQKVAKQKNQKVQSNTTAFIIKTHERSFSEAQIIVPTKYKQFSKLDSILIIEPPNKQFVVYAQITSESLLPTQQQNQKGQISILKNISDQYGAILGDNGIFRGEIRLVNEKQIIPNRQLQYAEIVIRKTYFSRRDQYKICQILKQKITHVFNRKVLHFQNMKVQVTNMMKNNQQIFKTGFITKNTKLIFRSGCTKTAILIELSKQTFDLNSTRQLYLERMIQFLIIYFNRNQYFNNKHRIQIILYARLFYPEFNNLNEAYNYLMKQSTLQSSQNKFQVNYAVSLQKDFKGRIYQDAYRKIIWQSISISNFKKYFLEKVSQFMFTLNWDYNKSKHSEFISKSINSKVANQFECVEIPQTWRIKPFIHRMKCELAASHDSNLFEAICLVSQQYKHHYKFRALDETGNAIIILSAGRSEYETDRTTYKMAKSYIYLTNISCMMVNVNKKVDKIKVKVYDIPRNIFKDQHDIKKLERLVHWCIQQLVYQSPINQRICFTSHKAGFQMKSFIYPHDIVGSVEANNKFKDFSKDKCYCRHSMLNQHYYLNQQKMDTFEGKIKQIDWINSYFISNEALKIHEKFYGKTNFQTNFYQPYNKIATKQPSKQNDYNNLSYSFINQLDIFQDDLQKIIIKKETWFQIGPAKNQLNLKFDKYIKQSSSIRKMSNEADRKVELIETLQKTNKKMFQIQTRKQEHNVDFDLSSAEDILDKTKNRMEDFHEVKMPKSRKNSEYIASNIFINQAIQIKQQVEIQKPKINIFEQTLRNKQYNIANINKQKSKKTLSHNKERLRGNYKQSNIHYLMTYYVQNNIKKLNKFIRKQPYQSHQQIKINQCFEYEKQWKYICFPILTPIYTKYRQIFQQIQFFWDLAQTGDDITLENEICKLLVQNYQLSEVNANKTIFKFSKGNIIKTLTKNDNNITKAYTIDKQKQQNIIPFLLYRYLLYEQKDYRFCSKTIYFQDKNYYDQDKKDTVENQTKTLKLLFLCDPTDDCKESFLSYNPNSSNAFLSNGINKKSPIEDFKRLFKQKFHQQMVIFQRKEEHQLSTSLQFTNEIKQEKQAYSPRKLLKSLNIKIVEKGNIKKSLSTNEIQFSKQKKLGSSKQLLHLEAIKTLQLNFILGRPTNKKYNSQEIKMIYDSEFLQRNLFKIVLEWDHCSSILVSQFVQNLITIGRRSKFNHFLTTTEDVFNIQWNMNVVGQIVFSNQLAVQLLEYSVNRNDEWYYDTMGYYMDVKGIAFIKFQKLKKLILWKDNNYEKKNRQPELYKDQYNKFFMLSAAFDFLGQMMEQAYHIYSRNINLNQMQETKLAEEYSMQGSYSSQDVVCSPIKNSLS